MLNQQTLNERLQDSTDQMNARLQALLTITNDIAAAGVANAAHLRAFLHYNPLILRTRTSPQLTR